MTFEIYQKLILEGIQGLPPEALLEITDFIFFIRKRVTQPQAFEEEMENALIARDLKQLGQDEAAHLEKEFENYRAATVRIAKFL